MTYWRITRHVHLLIPEELLAEVDAAAVRKYLSRSEFIRRTLDEKVTGKYQDNVKKIEEKDPTLFADLYDS